MRAPAPTIGLFLLLAGTLTLAACVPRPARLGSPSPTVPDAGATPSLAAGPEATPTAGPVGPTPSPSFARPTPLPAPTFLTYTVKSGDTLTSIARAFRTTPRSIAFWSRGQHASLDPESATYRPDRLEVGWILLLIPDAVFDEDELMDATPRPTPVGSAAATAGASPAPTASATAS